MQVKKTYSLSPKDQERLISIACRYPKMRTVIDEEQFRMYVFTNWGTNEAPTSIANGFTLIVDSTDPPRMPEDELMARSEKFPREEWELRLKEERNE